MTDMANGGCSIVCHATELKDREQLLGFGDVYGGMDYMTHMFEKFVTSHQYRSFVCEVDGRIAAFQFYRFIDDHNGVIGGGLRTHEDFRGQKLAKLLGEFSAQEILKEYPLIFRNYLMTAVETPFQHQRIKENPDEYTLLSRRNIRSLRITTSNIKAYISSQKPNNIKIVQPSLDEFFQHMLDDDTKMKLFPDKYIMVGWEPFHLLRDNLNDIYQERNVIWTANTNGGPDWMTIEYVFPCETGLRIDLDMYGEPNGISTHVAHSLACALEKYPDFEGTCELLIYSPMQFPMPDDLFENDVLPGALAAHKSYLVIHRNMMQR